MNADDIKARLRVVCICKAIKMGKVRDAIAKGCTSVEEVNKATGCGTGDCGATRCRPVIEAELAKARNEIPQQKD